MERKGDVLYNVLDQYTGENVNYEKTLVWADGTPMSDAKCDGVIYRKYETEYFMRSYTGSSRIEWFGAKGDGMTNDYPAFVRAGKSGVGLIKLSDKVTYLLDNGSGNKLQNMLVTSTAKFVGGTGTKIKFTYNGLPLFLFKGGDGIGVENVDFIFSGNTQTVEDFTKNEIMAQSGMINNSSPASREFWSVIYTHGVENLSLENLSFESYTKGDASKGISFCINLKGDEDNDLQSSGMSINKIVFRDCIHGILNAGQKNFRIIDIQSDRRFGNEHTAPGHVIYTTGGRNGGMSTDGVIDNVTDFGNPINLTGRALATLAIKNLHNCKITNILTYHPEGLVQSFSNIQNCYVDGMTFINKSNLDPVEPQINFSAGEMMSGNIFKNVTVISPNNFFSVRVTSDLESKFNDNIFENFYIKSNLSTTSGFGSIGGSSVFNIYGSRNRFRNISIEPSAIIGSTYNTAFAFRGLSSENLAEVKLVGKFANQRVARSLFNTGSGNSYLWDIQSPIAVDDLTTHNLDANDNTARLTPLHNRAAFVSNTNTLGVTTQPIKLPSKGTYLFSVSVVHPSLTRSISGVFIVSFSNSNLISSVTKLGESIVVGGDLTELIVTVDVDGVLSVSYTKVVAFYERVSYGYTKLSNINTLI